MLFKYFNSYYSYLRYSVTPRVDGVFTVQFETSQSSSIPQTLVSICYVPGTGLDARDTMFFVL